MTTGSLRLRLIAAAAAALAMALAMSGMLLNRLFVDYAEQRVHSELANHLNQIIGGLEIDPDGQVQLTAEPADPRFFTPASGLYWQLELPGGGTQRSRSLWDSELKLPVDELADGAVHRHQIAAPTGGRLVVAERAVTIGPQDKPVPVRLSVAVDRKEIDDATADFRNHLIVSTAVMATALLAALWTMIGFGLRPLSALGAALQRVHAGRSARVDGDFPSEVMPLIRDMNALLDKEKEARTRARERASDLAHGFKTPLTVLAAVARDLSRDGHDKSATEIETQVEIMGRHVTRELARTRTVGAEAIRQASVPVRPLMNKLVAALQRISADRELAWTIDGGETARFAGDENDLLELCGNLCENAVKWARTRIAVRIAEADRTLAIVIEDDGPGIPAGREAEVLARGTRLDETGDGTGLGLAIVARIVDAYGGRIALSRSSLGGLAVRVELPGGGAASLGASG